MKTSQKTLLGFAGAVLLGILLLLVGTRIALSNYVVDEEQMNQQLNSDGSPANGRKMPMDQLTEFTSIDVSGTADVTIVQGDHWSVEVQVEPAKQKMMSTYVEDGRLVLSSSNHQLQKGWRWFSGNGVPFSAQVTMPSIDSLSASGRTSITLENFMEQQLSLELAGTSTLKGLGGEVEDLELRASGANNIDLTGVKVVNADLTGAGANNIALDMAGGTLSGNVSGVGNVEYSGQVSKRSLQISGMGQLTEK